MVRIKKIHLKNFRIHKDNEIVFYDKNIILGENGTGKSSIFYGILFGLIGNRIKDAINIRSINSFIRDFSSESKVTLVLEDGEEEYIVERIIRKSGSDSLLRKGNNIMATGLQNVDKELLKIIGINSPEKIIGILYIAQGDLGRFVQSSGTKPLSEALEKIFDVHYYTFIKDVISRVYKDILYEKSILSENLSNKERELNKFKKLFRNLSIEELENLYEHIKSSKEKYNRLSRLYNQVLALKNQIDQDLLEKEDLYKQNLDNINLDISNLESKILEISSEVSKLDYKKYRRDLLDIGESELLKKLKKYEERVKDVDKENLLFRKKYLSENLDLINKLQAYKDIEEKYNNIKLELEKITKDISELKAIQRELYKILDLLKEKKIDRCPVCRRPLDYNNIREIIIEREKELKRINYNLRALYNRQKDLEAEKSNMEYRFNKYNSIITVLKERNINIGDLELEKDRIIDELNEINNLLKIIEEKEQIEHTINYIKYKRLHEELMELKKELLNLKNKKTELEKILSKIDIMKRNVYKIEEILKAHNYDNLDILKKDLENLEKEIKKYENMPIESLPIYKMILEEYEKTRDRLLKVNKAINLLLTIKRVLDSFIVSYRKKLASNLSQVFSYYFKKIYLYGDIRDVKIEVSENRGEWRYFIYVHKYIDGKSVWREIREAGLSGGQIKILDLAFRMSIAHLINSKFKVLMLDEPTESMDENIRMSLASLLDSLKDYQLILCTHDELFKNKINGNVIYLSKKEE